MFFFRPSCCHESLGGRYQIIAFDVRITQHVISKIPVVLGYPVVLKCLLFSKRFFVACVEKGEEGVCTQATFFVVRLHFLRHFEWLRSRYVRHMRKWQKRASHWFIKFNKVISRCQKQGDTYILQKNELWICFLSGFHGWADDSVTPFSLNMPFKSSWNIVERHK